MLDLKWVLNNTDIFNRSIRKRGEELTLDQILNVYEDRRHSILKEQTLRQQLNDLTDKIGLNKQYNHDTTNLLNDAKQISDMIRLAKEETDKHQTKLNVLASYLPNILDESVPEGKTSEDNIVMSHFDSVNNKPSESVIPHYQITNKYLADGAKIAGSKFVALQGDLATLERAISSFMIDFHVQNGYTEVSVPVIASESSAFGSGQLPKFKEDMFRTDNMYLIPTSEISLVNLMKNEKIDIKDTPRRFVALSPCFRKEAGAAGRESRGMIRLHQFNKVELVSCTNSHNAQNEHNKMLSDIQKIMEMFDLKYRVVLLCSGDTGFTSKKTYDIEVWIPSMNQYVEISSCSWCGDFQSRRLNAKIRNEDNKLEYMHTLNGSGTAVGRMLIAIIENYQYNGIISIPKILNKYTDIKEIII